MTIEKLKSIELPDAPGVYFFLGAADSDNGRRGKSNKEILYIGKATSLKNRVRSYFNGDLINARGPMIAKMVDEATDVSVQETDSVLEALILEANLIKKHRPKYNSREKDDKSFNSVVITNEDFPRLLTVRSRDLSERFSEEEIKYAFGPFPQGGQFKEALRIIRKIFPYRDEKCTPMAEQRGTPKPCFNYQIGLCPGICTGEISKREYARTIQHLRLFFEGKKGKLIEKLEKEMQTYAEKEQFEKAADVRRKLFALQHIQDVSLIKRESNVSERAFRVEGYDVAHTGETERVGVMTVIENELLKKADYRQFKIRRKGGGDTGALSEILERRFKHTEWPMPNLIVVDGGKAQVNAAKGVLEAFGYAIPIVGVVKDERHKPREIIGASKKIRTEHERDILLANSEAHRFALAFHRKRRTNVLPR